MIYFCKQTEINKVILVITKIIIIIIIIIIITMIITIIIIIIISPRPGNAGLMFSGG